MRTSFDDIVTPRLILRLLDDETVAACLSGDLARAEHLLGVAVPAEVTKHVSGFRYSQKQLVVDPEYRPWSMRAMIVPQERAMIGHARFHSRPGPDYLRRYAQDAVELGYRVLSAHRRRGYAVEAVEALMAWAQTTFGVSRFVASVSPDNQPSLQLVARFGFVKVGEEIDEIDGIEHVFLRIADPT